MSKYTTELRYICENMFGLTNSLGYEQVDTIVNNSIKKIFDFDYPIFDESYRNILERKIIFHYYTREIGAETYGLWKLWLRTKLNEIMPYYNKLYSSELLEFNPLYLTDITKSGSRSIVGKKKESEHTTDEGGTTTEAHTKTENDTDSETWNLYSDTPQGGLNGLTNENYLTNATHVNGRVDNDVQVDSEGETKTDNERNRDLEHDSNSTEEYLEKVQGYSGKNASKLLKEYRETFLNIDMMVIKELEPLFMQLW